MEFLDITLTNGSSLLLHTIHSPFYGRILKENHTVHWLGLKILLKNPRNKKTRVYSWIAICKTENEGGRADKNSSLRRVEFMPRNLDKKCRSRILSLDP
jgi:hypothetical protein